MVTWQIHRACHSPYLAADLDRYYNLSLRIWYLLLDRIPEVDHTAEHLPMIESILTRDAARARRVRRPACDALPPVGPRRALTPGVSAAWAGYEVYVLQVATAYTLTNARSRLGELVNRARFGQERVILSEHGTPVAAIISVEELAELQAAMDAADIAAAMEAKARSGPGIPHEEVMAMFDAMDEADQASSPEEAARILAPHATLIARVDAYEPALER